MNPQSNIYGKVMLKILPFIYVICGQISSLFIDIDSSIKKGRNSSALAMELFSSALNYRYVSRRR